MAVNLKKLTDIVSGKSATEEIFPTRHSPVAPVDINKLYSQDGQNSTSAEQASFNDTTLAATEARPTTRKLIWQRKLSSVLPGVGRLIWQRGQQTVPAAAGVAPVARVPITTRPISFTRDVFVRLQQDVRSGKTKRSFPIGTEIPDKWRDPETGIVYDAPLIVAHYGTVRTNLDYDTDPEQQRAVYLVRKYALPAREFKAIVVESRFGSHYSVSDIKNYFGDDYLAGCSDRLVSVLAMPEVITIENCICHARYAFFPPSLRELGFPEGSNDEGVPWDLFDDPTIMPQFFDMNGKPCDCWLRSRHPRYEDMVQYLTKDGDVARAKPDEQKNVIVACVIA